MRDAVRLQELEDECGVNLAFVENEFAPGQRVRCRST